MAKFLITIFTVFCVLQIVTSNSSEEGGGSAAAESREAAAASSEEKSEEKIGCACPSDYMNPVCGSNGQTYPSKCLLNCAKKRVEGLRVASEGRCGISRKTKGSKKAGRPRESLSCFCRKHIKEVCGSDGKIYKNKCLLKCARKSNPDLKKVKLEDCSDSDNADSPAGAKGRTYYYSGNNYNHGHDNYGHDNYGHDNYGHGSYSHEHYKK